MLQHCLYILEVHWIQLPSLHVRMCAFRFTGMVPRQDADVLFKEGEKAIAKIQKEEKEGKARHPALPPNGGCVARN